MSDLVMHSSESDEWYTPPHIIRAILEALGEERFALDAASGAEEVPYAHHTIEEEEDGLQADWQQLADGPIWLNYPYSSHADWMEKAREEAEAGDSMLLVLTKVASSTQWWKDNVPQADLVCKIHKRVTFGGSSDAAPYPSALVVYNYDGTPELLLTWGLCESPSRRVDLPPATEGPEVKGHRWSKEHSILERDA